MTALELSACVCGRPRHRGMCSERWALRRSGEGLPPRPKLKPEHSAPGTPKRRFTEHTPPGAPYTLAADHPAVREARTLFAARRVRAALQDRLLKSAEHNRKIGGSVTKGHLRGIKVFTLTLEERATCPKTCVNFRDCYGNNMNWSSRIQVDGDLMILLSAEVRKLVAVHGRILVRLHVLGDFFSTAYVAFWHALLHALPGLHLYGYTARNGCAIGREIERINEHPRCWIRFSGGRPGQFRALTVESVDQAAEAGAIVCPVQTNRTDCCGTCGLCWSTPKPIAFLRH